MEATSELIQRPFLDLISASSLLERHYGMKASGIKVLESFTDQNFHIWTDVPIGVGQGGCLKQCDQFILKVYNTDDSVDGNRIELAVNTMAYLWRKGICCPHPVRNRQGKLLHLEKMFTNETGLESGGKFGLFMVVLLTFIPGQIMGSLDPVPGQVFVDTGRQLASMHKLLENALIGPTEDIYLQRLVKDFEDYNRERPSAYCSGQWSLDKLTGQRRLLPLVEDTDLRRAIEKVIDLYEEHVEPVLPLLKKGIIHGDINDGNVITNPQVSPKSNDHSTVAGIIDFGDVAHTYVIFDLAIAAAELMTARSDNDLASAGQFLSGYQSRREIPDVEKRVMYYLVMARQAQHVMLCLEAIKKDPANDYIMQSVADNVILLQKLLSMRKSDVESAWNI